jgi:drug/metabolite transporter (DMT)-like permease
MHGAVWAGCAVQASATTRIRSAQSSATSSVARQSTRENTRPRMRERLEWGAVVGRSEGVVGIVGVVGAAQPSDHRNSALASALALSRVTSLSCVFGIDIILTRVNRSSF